MTTASTIDACALPIIPGAINFIDRREQLDCQFRS